MRQTPPDGYEEKFAGFIRACAQAKANGTPNVIVAQPQTLGDTYDEVIQSLQRLADARLALVIAMP